MNAPDKIWAYTYDIQQDDGLWDKDLPSWTDANPYPILAVEYIRADIATELLAALKSARPLVADMARSWEFEAQQLKRIDALIARA